MADIRIFSYLPNPRLYKATIAARYSGATIEIIGARPKDLTNWLWDYDAHELSDAEKLSNKHNIREAKMGFSGQLFKTDAFLKANPFGDVPAAFGDDGATGLFESNSIMRAAARIGGKEPSLYGDGPVQESRIDGFLDRSLVFAVNTQRYLLSARGGISPALHSDMSSALSSYLAGINQALSDSKNIAGDQLSLADIVFVCEVALFSNEVFMSQKLSDASLTPLLPRLLDYEYALDHFKKLSAEPNFNADLGDYFERVLAIEN